MHDGLGLKLLAGARHRVALITARESAVVPARARDLGMRHVLPGVSATSSRACAPVRRAGPRRSTQVAYMGDDLPDLAVFAHVGLAVAPANAHPWVRERVHWVHRARAAATARRASCAT